ncbi:MAG: tyrosinase family protein [Pseudomonadota bacterium]
MPANTINLFDPANRSSRRVFIRGVGTISLSLFASLTLGGCETIRQQIENRPVRRRLRLGSVEVDNDIAILTDGVARMKALPSTDPRNWTAISRIHGTADETAGFCEHASTHFLSWHRAYLYFLERIIRKLTGESDWALPYWNWNQNPRMHPAFRSASSTLDHPRDETDMTGLTAFQNVRMNAIMGEPNFFEFSSQLEGTPHNMVHSTIGRDMVLGSAPIDPIFWAHHSMVDYCWAKWNIELENSSPGDRDWIRTNWTYFVNEDGESVEMSAGTTLLLPLLSYRFEASPVGGFVAPDLRPSRPIPSPQSSPEEFTLLEERIRKGAIIREEVLRRFEIVRDGEIQLTKPLTLDTNIRGEQLTNLMAASNTGERLFLKIDHARLPPTNDFYLRVFLNMPDANVMTSNSAPQFAGSYAFFGTASRHANVHSEKHRKTDFLINISQTIERLSQAGLLEANQTISVQLVPTPFRERQLSRPEARLGLAAVDLTYSRAIVELVE